MDATILRSSARRHPRGPKLSYHIFSAIAIDAGLSGAVNDLVDVGRSEGRSEGRNEGRNEAINEAINEAANEAVNDTVNDTVNCLPISFATLFRHFTAR